ncbi:MAG: hypothetical protein LBE79_05155 [Tannerella sp.]|jgi:hypothetical protein|nr:hypothetical protein [Tannerella sp.]
MKNLKFYLCCTILWGSIQMSSAQEYKYFNLTSKGNSIVSFEPKHLKIGATERKFANNWTIGVAKRNAYYFDAFAPIYKEIFGTESLGEPRLIARILCTFWYKEDFKPYYYQIMFPIKLLDEFPQWEEKLYQLCERSMKVDIRPFIELHGDKARFERSYFEINLGNLYQFTQGIFRPQEY